MIIAHWPHQGTLYQNSDHLTFKNQKSEIQFEPAPYQMNDAVSLIKLFRKTIGKNLEGNPPSRGCFLPKLCQEAHMNPQIKAALFSPAEPPNELRWGVSRFALNLEQTFEADSSDLSRAFSKKNIDAAHFNVVFDRQINKVSLQLPLIAQWKQIKLYHYGDQFAYKVEDNLSIFKSSLYNKSYALNLISMFHETVGINLERGRAHSSCFLPRAVMEAHNNPDVLVALFGYVDVTNSVTGELKGMRWGVYRKSTQVERTLEVGENDLARTFVENAPSSNHELLNDKNGDPIKRGHFAMTSYAARYCPVVTEDNRVLQVALRYVSLLDKKVFLDEENWALTLVSTKQMGRTFITEMFDGDRIGHAMAAFEGVKEGKPFLKYAHLINLKACAQVECFEKEPLQYEIVIPKETINGPTFVRPKNIMEMSFKLIEKFNTTFDLSFSFNGGMFKQLSKYNHITNPDSLNVEEFLQNLTELNKQKVPMNCLETVIQIAAYAGIYFPEKISSTPLGFVEKLKSARVFTVPPNFDHDSGFSFRFYASRNNDWVLLGPSVKDHVKVRFWNYMVECRECIEDIDRFNDALKRRLRERLPQYNFPNEGGNLFINELLELAAL